MPDDLADKIAALEAALIAEREKGIAEAARAARVEAELAVAKAKASEDAALIAHQRLEIAKLTRQLYGPRSERTARLLDQLELTFEEFESSASEDEIAAERAVRKTTNVAAFTRKRPARQPFPAHLPRERVVEPAPAACQCFSIRPWMCKTFLIGYHTSPSDRVTRGPVLLSGIGTMALPIWDQEDEAEQSAARPSPSVTERTARATNSPHPSSRGGRSFRRRAEFAALAQALVASDSAG
jgi:transposase IS166 family protein